MNPALPNPPLNLASKCHICTPSKGLQEQRACSNAWQSPWWRNPFQYPIQTSPRAVLHLRRGSSEVFFGEHSVLLQMQCWLYRDGFVKGLFLNYQQRVHSSIWGKSYRQSRTCRWSFRLKQGKMHLHPQVLILLSVFLLGHRLKAQRDPLTGNHSGFISWGEDSCPLAERYLQQGVLGVWDSVASVLLQSNANPEKIKFPILAVGAQSNGSTNCKQKEQ